MLLVTFIVFVLFFVYLAWFIIRIFTRKPKKQPIIGMLVCFIAFFGCLMLYEPEGKVPNEGNKSSVLESKSTTSAQRETESNGEAKYKSDAFDDQNSSTDGTKNKDDEPEEEQTTFILDVPSISDSDIGKDLDTGNLNLMFGDLLSVKYSGNGVFVVKAKIDSSATKKQTIRKNYFSVGDLIRNHGFGSCKELQYWAVADMTSGDEAKVISFTLYENTIAGVANGNIVDSEISDYVADLWIHPSLKD